MALRQFTPQRITGLVNTIHTTLRKRIVRETIIKTRENQLAIRAEFGHEAPTELFVDGELGKPLNQVQHVTLTRFHLQNGIVDAAYRMLVERSPYGPDYQGHYQDDHWIYKNGVRVEHKIGGPPIEIGPRDKVVITNMRPYARKLEGGATHQFRERLTNRRPGLSAQAPDGVYEITARDLQRVYSHLAEIRFAYRGVIGGVLVFAEDPRPSMRGRKGRFTAQGGPRPGNKSADRFPSLEIESRIFN